MKQILQSYKTGRLSLEEVPRPSVAPGFVLVRTMASLVSAGTERMLVELAKKSLVGKARARPDLVRKVIATAKKEGVRSTLEKVRSKLENPIPLGYSCAGVVEEVGEGVEGVRVGDRVACAGAGYANHAAFNVVPRNLCVRIPDAVDGQEVLSFSEAAFATVGAIALQGVRQAQLTLGERVAVIGLGLIGQLTAQLCKANGCRVLGSDVDVDKLALARQLGVDDAVPAAELERAAERFSRGVGVDAVLITAAAAGSELIVQAGEISRPKGRVVAVGFVGLDVPRETYYRKELDLRLSMSYGPGRYDVEYEERGHDYPLPYVRWTEGRNLEAFLDLLAGGGVRVEELITHRFPFDRALEAYDLITEGGEPHLGVVLEYGQAEEPSRTVVGAVPSVAAGEVGLGVVGAGNFAKGVLLPRFARNPKVKQVGIASAQGMSARAVAEQLGFAYCAAAEEMLRDEAVNTVLIATRHRTHGEWVCRALEAGKHVWVEKPLCLTPEELEAIERIYRSQITDHRSPLLMVGFNRRFSPLVRKMSETLRGRGTPLVASYRINAGVIPKDSWIQDPVEGGGRIIGEVCHFVDLLRHLVGAPVSAVQAVCVRSDHAAHTDADSVSIQLAYGDGSVGTILYHALGSPDYPKEKLEVSADGRTLVLDDFRELEIVGDRRTRERIRQDKGFDGAVEAFVAAVTDGGPPPIPFAEIAETTSVTFAVRESLCTGNAVPLPGMPGPA